MRLAALLGALAALWVAPSEAHAQEAERYRDYRDLDYDLGTPPRPPSTRAENRLDLYVPSGADRRSRRPVVVWIHGGGWRKGDKRVGIRRKAELFARAGYVLASVNYRLSAAPFDPVRPDRDRVRFPAHPEDVGEALGWLDRNVGRFGGDRRRMVLAGHSAGAHLASLVATAPRYARAYGVDPRQIAGFVALDTPSFDIAAGADGQTSTRPEEGREMFWNAFGAPGEPFARRTWLRASPVRFADPGDPPALLVTQLGNEQRRSDHRAMALALARRPRGVVRSVDLDHREINHALGIGGDPAVTAAVMRFIRDSVRRR